MEVMPGYLQTDVGVTPEDWDIVHLGDIIDYVKGYAFQPVDYRPYGVRIIRVSDTTFDSVRNDNEIFIDSDKAKSYVRWALKKNDLLLSTVGSKPPMYDSMVGRVVIIDSRTEGALLNQNAVLLRSKDKKSITQTLLLNHFKTKRYSQFIETIFRGNANQASITLKDLFKFELAIPKRTEEISAIATTLSDADAHISSLDKIIAKKRDIKQAAMQDLLMGKRRQPGFDGEKDYKQIDGRIIPEDWEVKPIGDLCIFQNGASLERLFNNTGGYKVISIGNYSADGKYIDNNTFIDFAYRDDIKKFVLHKNDLTILLNDKTSQGTILGRVLLFSCNEQFVFNQRTMRLTPKEGIESSFLYQAINGDYLHRIIVSLAKPGTQIYLNTSDVTNLKVPYPPDDQEQRAIATVLSDMDAELTALEQQRDKTKAIKQGMMQELLTGRIRLT